MYCQIYNINCMISDCKTLPTIFDPAHRKETPLHPPTSLRSCTGICESTFGTEKRFTDCCSL